MARAPFGPSGAIVPGGGQRPPMAIVPGGGQPGNIGIGGMPLMVPGRFTGILPAPGEGQSPQQAANALLLNPMMVRDTVVQLRKRHQEQHAEIRAALEPGPELPPGTDASSYEPPDYYKALQVKKGGQQDDIKKSYRKLVLLWHPDKHPENREEADEKIRLVNAAYETLGNPVKRAGYDQMLEALERKKKNIRLDTTLIQPRMSIPKEFLLCPLGHPDKYVRAVGNDLRVQSRDEVSANFKDFFSSARFSLWWLPEVNNMCRLRTAESAKAGVEGGNNVNFLMEGAPTEGGQIKARDADCILRRSEDPRYSNVIAVASPFSPGAFRFEGAFWPGHYLSFRAPSTICMAGLVDEIKDVTDFYLVDYSAAYNTMTLSEALLHPVQAQGGDYMKLSDLRADLSVRMYFQKTMASPVWNNKEFELFFEAHYDEWDFDKKKARVRAKPPEQRLAERLKSAKQVGDLAQLLLGAGEELCRLPSDLIENLFTRLTKGMPAASAEDAEKAAGLAARLRDVRAARQRLVAMVPRIVGLSFSVLTVPALLSLHIAAKAAVDSDPKAEAEHIAEGRAAAQHPVSMVGERLQRFPGELTCEILPQVIALPLNWEKTLDPLLAAADVLLKEPQAAGAFLGALRAAVQAGPPAARLAEALARRELQAVDLAQGEIAGAVLTVIAEGGLLLGDVAARLRPPVLTRLSLGDVVRVLARLGREQGDAVKLALEARLQGGDEEKLATELAAVPSCDLLRLAQAASTSPAVEELALGPVARAAASALETWPAGDVAGMVLPLVTSGKACESAQKCLSRVAEVLTPLLKDVGAEQLLEVVLSIRDLEPCKAFYEAVAAEIVASHLQGLSPTQLVQLVEGLLPLGIGHSDVERLLDFWTELLAREAESTSGAGASQADELARLVELLAPARPTPEKVLGIVAARIEAAAESLTSTGRAALESAFPSGAGPAFPGKEKLMRAVGSKNRDGRKRDNVAARDTHDAERQAGRSLQHDVSLRDERERRNGGRRSPDKGDRLGAENRSKEEPERRKRSPSPRRRSPSRRRKRSLERGGLPRRDQGMGGRQGRSRSPSGRPFKERGRRCSRSRSGRLDRRPRR